MSEEHTNEEKTTWTEEFQVMGEELLSTLNSLFHDVTVSRVIVRNKKGRTLVDIPLTIGAAGLVLTLPYSAILLGVMWLTEFHITVERTGTQAESEAEAEAEAAPAAAAAPEPTPEAEEAGEEAPVSAESQRCQATTKAGTQCKRNAPAGSDFCGIHQS